MKAETCCCYVLSINYILYNKIVLDCTIIYVFLLKLYQRTSPIRKPFKYRKSSYTY